MRGKVAGPAWESGPDVVAATRALAFAAWSPGEVARHVGEGTPLRRYLGDLMLALTAALGTADAAAVEMVALCLRDSEAALIRALGENGED